MTRIPASALLLSVAGLIPFLIGALISTGYLSSSSGGFDLGGFIIFPATDGRLIMTRYGVIILCFMSGVLWGFATKAQGSQAAAGYVLSVLPALWILFNPGKSADEALVNLMIGFAGILMLDVAFHRWGLSPPWWLDLRVPLTVAVLACLAIGVWA